MYTALFLFWKKQETLKNMEAYIQNLIFQNCSLDFWNSTGFRKKKLKYVLKHSNRVNEYGGEMFCRKYKKAF